MSLFALSSFNFLANIYGVNVCVLMCMCVCARERERERERFGCSNRR
jgi:hypothetical protein